MLGGGDDGLGVLHMRVSTLERRSLDVEVRQEPVEVEYEGRDRRVGLGRRRVVGDPQAEPEVGAGRKIDLTGRVTRRLARASVSGPVCLAA